MARPAVDVSTAMTIVAEAVIADTVAGAATMTLIVDLATMTVTLAHTDAVTTMAPGALIAMRLDVMTVIAAAETTIAVGMIIADAMLVVDMETHLQGILAIRTEVETPIIPVTIGTPVVRSYR